MDKVRESNANIFLLGDFNVGLFKQHPDSIISLLGFEQLVEEVTRATNSSATVIDHIYTKNKAQVSKVRVVESGIKDQGAISCHYSITLPKQNLKVYTTITFTSFKDFNETQFCMI